MGRRSEKRHKGQPQQPSARVNTPLFFLLAALLLLFGSYYDFTVLLAGAVLALLLIHAVLRRGALALPRGPALYLLGGIVLCAFLTAPVALSPGMALIGGLRWMAALLFFLYAGTYTGTEKRMILDSIAWLGAGMAAAVGICCVGVVCCAGVTGIGCVALAALGVSGPVGADIGTAVGGCHVCVVAAGVVPTESTEACSEAVSDSDGCCAGCCAALAFFGEQAAT